MSDVNNLKNPSSLQLNLLSSTMSPNSEGIVPVKLFPAISKIDKLISVTKLETSPMNLLFCKAIVSNATKFAKLLGSWPVRVLSPINKDVNDVNSPIFVGTLPVKAFPWSHKVTSPVIPAIPPSTVPVKLQLSRRRSIKFVCL